MELRSPTKLFDVAGSDSQPGFLSAICGSRMNYLRRMLMFHFATLEYQREATCKHVGFDDAHLEIVLVKWLVHLGSLDRSMG